MQRQTSRMNAIQTFYQSIPSSKVHKQQKDEEYIDSNLDKSHLAKRMKSTVVGNLCALDLSSLGLINYQNQGRYKRYYYIQKCKKM